MWTGKELGSGAYSHVFQATSVKDGQVVAVKKIKKEKLMKHDHEALKLEVCPQDRANRVCRKYNSCVCVCECAGVREWEGIDPSRLVSRLNTSPHHPRRLLWAVTPWKLRHHRRSQHLGAAHARRVG